jgi:hypothetical protein
MIGTPNTETTPYAQPTIPTPGESLLQPHTAQSAFGDDVKKYCGTCWGFEGTSNEREKQWVDGALTTSGVSGIAGCGFITASVSTSLGGCVSTAVADGLCIAGGVLCLPNFALMALLGCANCIIGGR